MIAERELSDMVAGYIEAALWSTTDESRDDGGDPLDQNYSAEDIDAGTLEKMMRECRGFAEANEALIREAVRIDEQMGGAEAWQAIGHDFWLTRNGHGSGFWDRDCPQELGDALTKACGRRTEFPNVDLYVGDDGRIYAMGGEP